MSTSSNSELCSCDREDADGVRDVLRGGRDEDTCWPDPVCTGPVIYRQDFILATASKLNTHLKKGCSQASGKLTVIPSRVVSIARQERLLVVCEFENRTSRLHSNGSTVPLCQFPITRDRCKAKCHRRQQRKPGELHGDEWIDSTELLALLRPKGLS